MLNRYILPSLSGFALILIPVSLIVFPQVLYGIPRTVAKIMPTYTEAEMTEDVRLAVSKGNETVKTQISHVSEGENELDPFYDLGERILQVMDEKKPYLDLDFDLDDLVEMLRTPKYHVYYCLKNVLNKKFTKLRMEYRIEYAKKELQEVDLKSMTIEAVGRNSGFATPSVFFNSFKNEVGCTPTEYLQSIMEQ